MGTTGFHLFFFHMMFAYWLHQARSAPGLQSSLKQTGMRISTSQSEAMVLEANLPSLVWARGPFSSGGIQVSLGLDDK